MSADSQHVSSSSETVRFTADCMRGGTLTIYVRHALALLSDALLSDLECCKRDVLVLTVHRTNSTDPRTFYALNNAQVIHMSVINTPSEKFSAQDPEGTMDFRDAETHERGHLGCALVMTFEQPEGDKHTLGEIVKTVHSLFPGATYACSILTSIVQSTVCSLLPLKLFEVTRRKLFPMVHASLLTP